MAQTTLEHILAEVGELSTEEKAKLIVALRNDEGVLDEDVRIEAFHQALLAAGMVTEIRPGRPHRRPLELVDIPGQPVSETLVEERR